jgi:hypothetical protein
MPAFTDNLHWRHTHHYVQGESIEVGDVPGHVLGAIKGAGLGFFENGDVATHSIAILHDFTNGTGPHSFYVAYSFEDGSTLQLRGQGSSTGEAGGKITLQGNADIVSGTGRFAGAKGNCTYVGKRLLTAIGGAEVYLDFIGSYSR